jgi:hypothetical protein
MLKAQYISNWRGMPRRPVLSTHLLETARTILSRVESLRAIRPSFELSPRRRGLLASDLQDGSSAAVAWRLVKREHPPLK